MNPTRPRTFILTEHDEEREGVEFSDGTIALQGHGCFASLAAVMENSDATVRYPTPPASHRTFTAVRNGRSFPGTRLASGALLIEYDSADAGLGLTPFTSEEALRQAYSDTQIIWDDAAPERIVIDAVTLYDIVTALKDDLPFPVTGRRGRTYEIVAGDHDSGEIGVEHADLLDVELRRNGQ